MKKVVRLSIPGWFSVLVSAALSSVRPTVAACVPPGTPGDDSILCTGADTAGIVAGSGRDVITVPRGAAVGLTGAAPTIERAAIDAGPGNDEVSSAGSVLVQVSSLIAPEVVFPSVPASIWDISTTGQAVALGLFGGSGTDELFNYGAIGIAAFTQIDSAAAVARLDSTGSVLASSNAIARATGAAGTGSVTIASGGPVDVRASASSAALSGSILLTGGMQPLWHGGTSAIAHADGLTGGEQASDLRNFGALSVDAGATTRAVDAALTLDGFVSAALGTQATAAARGIAGEARGDKLSNEGDLAVSAATAARGMSIGFAVDLDVAGAAAGEVLVDASVRASSAAVGMDGGDGDDALRSDGSIAVNAAADASGIGASVGVAVAMDGNVTGAALSDATVTGAATATGVAGGAGADRIDTAGGINVQAVTEAAGVAASVAISGSVASGASGRAIADAAVLAQSAAIGVAAGARADEVTSAADLTTMARAIAAGTSVAVPVVIAREGAASGVGAADVSVAARADSRGIDGGSGSAADVIANTGALTLGAVATSTGVAASLTVAGSLEGEAGGSALMNARVTAEAGAMGIGTGSGDDRVTNAAGVGATANATATAVSAGVRVGIAADGSVAADANAKGGAMADASSNASAVATAIGTGAGADRVGNRGQLDAASTAKAIGVAASLDIAGSAKGDAAGRALSDATVTAGARSAGIAAGDGADSIVNSARVGTSATATGVGASISVPVAISKEGKAEGAALSRAAVIAESAAAGVNSGADENPDAVDNSGDIGATSIASATGVAAAVTIAGTAKGDVKGAALSDSSVTANAVADGIRTGAGNDSVTNTAKVVASTEAGAVGVSASVKVGFTKEGGVAAEAAAEGAAMSAASSIATARSSGLASGSGADRLLNQGEVGSNSTATATGVAASLDVAGTAKGDAAGAALSDAGVAADATSFGIAAGDGADTVTTSARIGATALATGIGASVSVPVAISKEGKAEGSAVTRTAVGATAVTTGVDTGSDAGRDVVTNAGAIEVSGTAQATGVAASISVAGTAKGDVKGAALSDSSVVAQAAVSGIATHDGNDQVTSGAKLTGDSTATAVGVSASVKVGFTKEGDVAAEAKAEGAAMSNASTEAHALVAGVDTGGGNDTVHNHGEMALTSTAKATGVAASLDVAGSAKGDVAGAALSDASVTAEAAAQGVSAGEGNDAIDNAARIGSTATATGVGVSAAVPVSISKEGKAEGAAVSRVSVDANAASAGIDAGSGSGSDSLTNSGAIASVSTARATGVAASISVAGTAKGDVKGSALSDSSVTAVAAANGVTTGAGVDRVTNAARVEAAADATSTGVSASVSVGFSKDGKVEADAVAEGSAVSDASSRAEARAGGIDAGAGADVVENHGELAVRASSTAIGVAASLDVAGSAKGDVAGGALADASVTAKTVSKGIDAGEGDDRVSSDNVLTGDVQATAIGAAAGLSVSITKEGKAEGKGVSNAGATATAAVTGIDGGDGGDMIVNSGTIRLQHLHQGVDATEANATAVAASVAVAGSAKGEVTAKALADASASAEAHAIGIAGGAGADHISNSGAIAADMDAAATTVAAGIGVAITVGSDEAPDKSNATGSAVSDASASAVASALGIDAGSGANQVKNSGALDLDASAQATSVAVSLTVGGTAGGDASADALGKAHSATLARSVGITAGADADRFDNRETIHVKADASSTTVAAGASVAITLNGKATGNSLSDSGASASAEATGMAVGDGSNRIDNAAAVSAAAESHATSVAVALTVAGTAQGDASGSALARASSVAESASSGIRAGSGADAIANHGALAVDASATGKTVAVGVGAALTMSGSADNAALSDASSAARATAAAIDAGAGDDTITNDAAIVLMPAAPGTNDIEARAESVAVSVTVTGTLGGDTRGKALSNASALAEAQGTGIAGGSGNDTATNMGAIDGAIDAYAKSVAAAAGVAVTVGGSAQGAAVSDASSTARARAFGIAGDAGADTLRNSGAISLQSGATADGVSLSIFLGGSLGTADQSAIANTRTTADALTVGLAGGDGQDRIENSGGITVGAVSALEGKSFAVNVNLLSGGLATQSTVADVSGIAAAWAGAISGGAGDDYVRNLAAETKVTAMSTARTSAYSISLSGLSVGAGAKTSMTDARTSAWSTAAGIDGGEGADDIGAAGKTTVLAKATSEGTATARNLTILNLGGDLQDAAAKSTTSALAIARGLDGGKANDRLGAYGILDIDAEAGVSGVSTATNVFGAGAGANAQRSVAQAGTVAEARAVGVDGGSGGNVIDNGAAITVDATATATTKSVSAGVTGFNLAGATYQDAAADASTTILSEATGLRGGEEGDTIGGAGGLTVTAKSIGNVVSSAAVESLTFIGSAKGKAAADASSLISATAAGVEGGDGNDTVTTSGAIYVDAIADGTTNASSSARAKVVFGSGSAKTATSAAGEAEATAAGITGGMGRDRIESNGLVDVGADAKLTVNASSVSVTSSTFGSAYAASAADSSSTARAVAIGLDGGDDADEIRNAGGVNAESHATTTVKQTSAALASSTFGSESTVANSDAAAIATAATTGIAGGGGADRIVSPAGVTVWATGSVTMDRLTLSSDGPSTADARTQTQVSAVGIDAGAGNDTIAVTGDISATATSNVASGSRTGGVLVDEDVRITIGTRAVGITGGAGDDAIESAGSVTVMAGSTLTSQAVTFAGVSVLKSRLTADAVAVGIEAGGGLDGVRSRSAMTVTATADVTSKQSTYSFGGGEGTSFLQAQSAATAFSAGGGLGLVNGSDAASIATSTVTAEDTTFSFSGFVSKELRGRSSATASGLFGGELGDSLENRAHLSVRATGTVTSSGRIDITFDQGTDQQLGFEAIATTLGASTAGGDDRIINAAAAGIEVISAATATVNGATSSCDGSSWLCGLLGWNANQSFNWADARADATAIGLDLGAGYDRVDNSGSVVVRSDAGSTATAISNADQYNESEAYADGTARAQTWGIRSTGTGAVLNRSAGSISVTAMAAATASAQGGKIGGTAADLKSAASSDAAALSTNFVDASQIDADPDLFVGKWVRFLTGANADDYAQVTAFDKKTGTITLDAPLAGALVAKDQYTVSEARNATSGAFASASATGIELQGAGAFVQNAGQLAVTATATADNIATVFGGQSAVSASATATARGIVTGDGNDLVVNDGSIVVHAQAEARRDFFSSDDMTAMATGIATGAGDDRIVNNGTISVTTALLGTSFGHGLETRLGTAISAGAGNDRLELGANSLTTGLVRLDDGDDRLILIGGARVNGLGGSVGTLDGGTGIDTLALRGQGAFPGSILAFERVAKDAGGTFMLSNLPTMRELEVSGGTLQINAPYTFDPNGVFRAWIYPDGSQGRLRVEGGTAQLAGEFRVMKGPGAYVDQSKYKVLETADGHGLLGHFDSVVLPDPTPLVSFSYAQSPDAGEITASVRSFTTLAGNDLQRTMAVYFDTVLPTATGDLSTVLGEVQGLPASQVGPLMATLSPAAYQSGTRASQAMAQQYGHMLQEHLSGLRMRGGVGLSGVGAWLPSGASQQAVFLAYNDVAASADAGLGGVVGRDLQIESRRRWGVWLDSFGQWGHQDPDDGFPGLHYDMAGLTLGLDYMPGDHLILGASVSYSQSNIDLDANAGNGDVDTTAASVYGTWFSGPVHVDTMLSYGRQSYDNTRNLVIGNLQRTAKSDHDGDLWAAYLGTGYDVRHANWLIGPYAALRYVYLSEDGFAETGAGSVNLRVDGHSTEALSSELGLRVAHVIEAGNGRWVPEVRAAWNYDFGIGDNTISGAFAGVPGASFSLPETDSGGSGATIGAGVTYLQGNGFSTSLQFNGEFREGYSAYGVLGYIRYAF